VSRFVAIPGTVRDGLIVDLRERTGSVGDRGRKRSEFVVGLPQALGLREERRWRALARTMQRTERSLVAVLRKERGKAGDEWC
jgi:hypothetical protein